MRKRPKVKSDPPSTITCKELHLVNDKGEMCATFSTTITGEPSLRMYDQKGGERLVIEVQDDTVRLVLNKNGTGIAMAVGSEINGCRIRFYDRVQSKCVAELGIDVDAGFSVRTVGLSPDVAL